MSRVVHFEIHADDPERAAKFYERALGWTISKWDGPVDYLEEPTVPMSRKRFSFTQHRARLIRWRRLRVVLDL